MFLCTTPCLFLMLSPLGTFSFVPSFKHPDTAHCFFFLEERNALRDLLRNYFLPTFQSIHTSVYLYNIAFAHSRLIYSLIQIFSLLTPPAIWRPLWTADGISKPFVYCPWAQLLFCSQFFPLSLLFGQIPKASFYILSGNQTPAVKGFSFIWH